MALTVAAALAFVSYLSTVLPRRYRDLGRLSRDRWLMVMVMIMMVVVVIMALFVRVRAGVPYGPRNKVDDYYSRQTATKHAGETGGGVLEILA